MEITPSFLATSKQIYSYHENGFIIATDKTHEAYKGAIIVLPEEVIAWDIADFDEFGADSLLPLNDLISDIEILLIGCGDKVRFIPPSMRLKIKEAGLNCGIEAMETGAACRAYNILMAEGRKVAAALLPLNKLRAKSK